MSAFPTIPANFDRPRAGEVDVLVCTDVAARGIDLPNLDLVIHADIATEPRGPLAIEHR